MIFNVSIRLFIKIKMSHVRVDMLYYFHFVDVYPFSWLRNLGGFLFICFVILLLEAAFQSQISHFTKFSFSSYTSVYLFNCMPLTCFLIITLSLNTLLFNYISLRINVISAMILHGFLFHL